MSYNYTIGTFNSCIKVESHSKYRQSLGHTYTKKLFVVYLKSHLTGHPVFLLAKSVNLCRSIIIEILIDFPLTFRLKKLLISKSFKNMYF